MLRGISRAVCFPLLFLPFASLALRAQVPTPEQFFGFKMGTDAKLARYDKIVRILPEGG